MSEHVLRQSFISACVSQSIDQRLIDEWVFACSRTVPCKHWRMAACIVSGSPRLGIPIFDDDLQQHFEGVEELVGLLHRVSRLDELMGTPKFAFVAGEFVAGGIGGRNE